VRQAFCDESYSRSSVFVVAGPIIHADTQLVPVEEHLEGLVAKYIPEPDREGFVFHAADLWNNNEYFADREKWPRDKCWNILWDLINIPAQFDLPIAVGLQYRLDVAERIKEPLEQIEEKYRAKAHDTATHSLAFVDFTYGVENAMRKLWPDEVAELVAENRQEVHDSLHGVHFNMRSKKWFATEWVNPPPEFPLAKIRGAIKFAAKRDEPALQIADACAYIIRAAVEGSLDHAPFYNLLRFWMLAHPKGLVWPPLEWPGGPLVPLWKETEAEKASPMVRLRRLYRRALRDARNRDVE
jgi:uncharacterized protein DUF3800